MFWNNVKTLLSEKKLLQKDFAEILGINISTLKNQMTRNIIPDAITSVKIAQSLDTTVEYLATGKQPSGLPNDIQNTVNELLKLPEKQREPIISLVHNQVDYWCNVESSVQKS